MGGGETSKEGEGSGPGKAHPEEGGGQGGMMLRWHP